MSIGLLFSTILPLVLTPILAISGKRKYPKRIKDTDKRFVIHPPNVISIGIMFMIIWSVFLILVTYDCYLDNSPDYIYHILMGSFNYSGAHLILTPLRSRIIVDDEGITIHYNLRKPYSFVYEEIFSVTRYGNNELYGNGEMLVIKTTSGRRVFIDVHSPRLLKRLKDKGIEVTNKILLYKNSDCLYAAKTAEPNIDFIRAEVCDVDRGSIQNSTELLELDQEEIQYSVDTFVYAVKVAEYIIKKYQSSGKFLSYRVVTITRYSDENIWHFEYLKGRRNAKVKNENFHVLIDGNERKMINAWKVTQEGKLRLLQ